MAKKDKAAPPPTHADEPGDSLESAKIDAPEEGTPEEALAAIEEASVSMPGSWPPPAAPPTPKFRVVADRKFSLRGQIISWKAGRVVDIHSEELYNQLRDAGVQLEPVRGEE